MSSKTFIAIVFAISAALAILMYLIPSSDTCVAKDIGQTQASSAGALTCVALCVCVGVCVWGCYVCVLQPM